MPEENVDDPSIVATYDAGLAEDKDWVRLQIGDRKVSTATFKDTEIQAILDEEENKWLAAARLGDMLLAQRRGAVSRSIEDLSISYGDSPESAYRSHVNKLREEGCRRLMGAAGRGVVLRTLG